MEAGYVGILKCVEEWFGILGWRMESLLLPAGCWKGSLYPTALLVVGSSGVIPCIS